MDILRCSRCPNLSYISQLHLDLRQSSNGGLRYTRTLLYSELYFSTVRAWGLFNNAVCIDDYMMLNNALPDE